MILSNHLGLLTNLWRRRPDAGSFGDDLATEHLTLTLNRLTHAANKVTKCRHWGAFSQSFHVPRDFGKKWNVVFIPCRILNLTGHHLVTA